MCFLYQIHFSTYTGNNISSHIVNNINNLEKPHFEIKQSKLNK